MLCEARFFQRPYERALGVVDDPAICRFVGVRNDGHENSFLIAEPANIEDSGLLPQDVSHLLPSLVYCFEVLGKDGPARNHDEHAESLTLSEKQSPPHAAMGKASKANAAGRLAAAASADQTEGSEGKDA